MIKVSSEDYVHIDKTEITGDAAGLRKGLDMIIPYAVEKAINGHSQFALFLLRLGEKILPDWKSKTTGSNITPEEYSNMISPLLADKDKNES